VPDPETTLPMSEQEEEEEVVVIVLLFNARMIRSYAGLNETPTMLLPSVLVTPALVYTRNADAQNTSL
jgi:hypothetical protein